MYRVNYMAQLTFYHLQKLALISILDFQEYILMALSYRFIHNVEVAIKDKERYFSNLQSWAKYLKKIEKSSKTGKEKKSLISTFACFLTAIAKL